MPIEVAGEIAPSVKNSIFQFANERRPNALRNALKISGIFNECLENDDSKVLIIHFELHGFYEKGQYSVHIQ